MNKTELIAAMAETSGLSKKDCDAALAAFITTVGTALKSGEKVQLIGFGSFEVKERAARTGRNPRTKETVEIPASKAPVFKAGQAFKDAIWEKIPGRAFCRTWDSCVNANRKEQIRADIRMAGE